MDNENKLSSLLDQVYELEGLIHITLNRENPPQVLASLIENKVKSIAALTPEAIASIPTEDTEDVMTVTPDVPPLPSPSVTSEAIADEEPIPMETVSPDYDLGEEYSDSADFGGTSDEPAFSKDDVYDISSNRKERSKPAFNLNDRYRFRRSLFKGSDEQYQEALSMAAEFDTLSEAEGYFYETLGWDRDNEEVKAFMELLQNHYK